MDLTKSTTVDRDAIFRVTEILRHSMQACESGISRLGESSREVQTKFAHLVLRIIDGNGTESDVETLDTLSEEPGSRLYPGDLQWLVDTLGVDDEGKISDEERIRLTIDPNGRLTGADSISETNRRVVRQEIDGTPTSVDAGDWGLSLVPSVKWNQTTTARVREIIERLDDYAVASDDVLSEVEHQRETDAWEDHGRPDFRDAIERLLGIRGEGAWSTETVVDVDSVSADVIDALWKRGTDGGSGDDTTHHNDGDVSFAISRVVQRIPIDVLASIVVIAGAEVDFEKIADVMTSDTTDEERRRVTRAMRAVRLARFAGLGKVDTFERSQVVASYDVIEGGKWTMTKDGDTFGPFPFGWTKGTTFDDATVAETHRFAKVWATLTTKES